MEKVRKYVCLVDGYRAFDKGIAYPEGSMGDNSCEPVEYFVNFYPDEWEVLTVHDFKVGQKVLCVDPDGYLVQGQKYTITNFGNAGVTVAECSVPQGAASYKANRFIPASIKLELDWDEVLTLQMLLDSEFKCSYVDVFREQIQNKVNEQIV